MDKLRDILNGIYGTSGGIYVVFDLSGNTIWKSRDACKFLKADLSVYDEIYSEISRASSEQGVLSFGK